jgi:hypothetical protein
MTLYCLLLIISAAIYICGEFFEVDMAMLASESYKPTNYVVQMIMIMLVLTLLPLSLYMFKFKCIHSSLIATPAASLLKWGTIRIFVLGLLLLSNTILYYMFGFEPAFGYLAVMVMLVMPFILPTMSRCKAETEEEPKVEITEDTELEA